MNTLFTSCSAYLLLPFAFSPLLLVTPSSQRRWQGRKGDEILREMKLTRDIASDCSAR